MRFESVVKYSGLLHRGRRSGSFMTGFAVRPRQKGRLAVADGPRYSGLAALDAVVRHAASGSFLLDLKNRAKVRLGTKLKR
jgi:hypothetical protein